MDERTTSMNFVKKWIIEKGVTSMLSKLTSKIDGYKTYILAVLGAIAAIIGHFWGPTNLGPIPVPVVSTDEMWKAIWAVASLASLRHGMDKKEDPTPTTTEQTKP